LISFAHTNDRDALVDLQVVLELHDVGDRLQVATDLLKTNGFSVKLAQDFPPQMS